MYSDYNKKGELSRTFHSMSFAAGFLAAATVNTYKWATGQEKLAEQDYVNKDFWINSSLGTITGYVSVAGLKTFSTPMYIIGLAGVLSDAFGFATGESFGAFKEGYNHVRSYNAPKARL